jgi:hypothetical protein
MNARKLQCMTTAEWLRGYISTLDQDRHSSLIHKMNQAAELLTEVWEEYLKESEK